MIAAGLLAPVALLAAGAVVFYVIKTPPPPGPCEEFLEPAERAVVDAYRSGLDLYGALFTLAMLPLIAWISAARRAASGWERTVTPETGAAIAAVVVLLALHVTTGVTFALHVVLAVLIGLVFGGFLMLLAAYSAVTRRRTRRASALGWVLVYDWTALLVALPALLAFPLGQGTDYFCINGIT